MNNKGKIDREWIIYTTILKYNYKCVKETTFMLMLPAVFYCSEGNIFVDLIFFHILFMYLFSLPILDLYIYIFLSPLMSLVL